MMFERCLAAAAVLVLFAAALATCAEGDAQPVMWVLR